MNENFNRQFILIDFLLLDDPKFLEFTGKAEFATYLVLRRFIWRGGKGKPHFMGLHQFYEQKNLLVCSISNDTIAHKLGFKGQNSVTKPLTKLEKLGIIKRIRTGRQSIFVLGEWIDYSEKKDGSRRVEWFYLEQKFGISKTDQSKMDWSDQSKKNIPDQSKMDCSYTNREENREINNTVNVRNGNIKNLKKIEQPEEKTEYLAEEILNQLKDKHSARFYYLIASRIPESIIRTALAEIKTDGAENPAKVFTYKMKKYAEKQETIT